MTCRRVALSLALVAFGLGTSVWAGQTIHTVVGGGPDHAPAVLVSLNPDGLGTDADGNVFFGHGARVFKMGPDGVMHSVAGVGISGYGGDGGPATNALLRAGVEIVSDSLGNLYFADRDNHRIRKVDTSGIITTVAGDGTRGSGGDGGPAIAAQLDTPVGLAVDGDDCLYVAEAWGHRVRKVDTSGDITTVAGRGVAGFSGDGGLAVDANLNVPHSVSVDAAGNLYIADHNNNRIRMVDTGGVISTVAGDGVPRFFGDGGPATAASINRPVGVAAEADGSFYISDLYNLRIRKVDLSQTITTIAGNGGWGYSGDDGPATNATMTHPRGVTVDAARNVYFCDSSNRRIRKVDADGIITTVAGSDPGFIGDGYPATGALLNHPLGLVRDAIGNLYLADAHDNRVRKVDTDGIISTHAGIGGWWGPLGDGGPATDAFVYVPHGLALRPTGELLIADHFNYRVREIAANGIITTVAGGGGGGDGSLAVDAFLGTANGLATDALGNIFVAEYHQRRVRKIDTAGYIWTIAGSGCGGYSGDGGPATDACLGVLRGLAVDAEGNVYIADEGNQRVRKVDTNGIITTFAGNGSAGFGGDGGPASDANLHSPRGLAIGPAGNLFIADVWNHRVRRVDPLGKIWTVAGTGEAGFGGDGGPPTAARLVNPTNVLAIDGDLYISDTNNFRVRWIDNDDYDWDDSIDGVDNCVHLFNPAQADIDLDNVGDLCDTCPADDTDQCDADGSTAAEVPADDGGTIETPDGNLEIDIDPGDLSEDTTISVTQLVPGDPEVDLTVGPNPGLGQAVSVYDLEPDGLVFDSPVTLTIVADISEFNPSLFDNLSLYLWTDTDADGVEDTFVEISSASCSTVDEPAGCDPRIDPPEVCVSTATCTADVDHFSVYALVAPLDSDGDGVPDRFGGEKDGCPYDAALATPEFDGFLSPVGGADESGGGFGNPVRSFKWRSTVPLKFRMFCGGESVLTGIHTLQTTFWSSETEAGEPVDASPQDAATQGNEFRLTGGEWHFNLDLQGTGMSQGQWELVATVDDGTQHRVWIQVK